MISLTNRGQIHITQLTAVPALPDLATSGTPPEPGKGSRLLTADWFGKHCLRGTFRSRLWLASMGCSSLWFHVVLQSRNHWISKWNIIKVGLIVYSLIASKRCHVSPCSFEQNLISSFVRADWITGVSLRRKASCFTCCNYYHGQSHLGGFVLSAQNPATWLGLKEKLTLCRRRWGLSLSAGSWKQSRKVPLKYRSPWGVGWKTVNKKEASSSFQWHLL